MSLFHDAYVHEKLHKTIDMVPLSLSLSLSTQIIAFYATVGTYWCKYYAPAAIRS